MTHPRQPSRAQPPPQPPRRERRAADGQGDPERLYTITGGTEGAERAPLDLVTLIVARSDPPPASPPEQAALLRLCKSPLSTAEISAYLSLPFSVVTVLLGELLAAELVQARAPVIRGAVADRSLLEAVMHGLQKL